jgi:hypothetical protein
MKKIILVLFSILTILISCGQNDNLNKKFQKDIKEYTEAYSDHDWEKVTDMIWPKLFDSLPKQQMILFLMLSESIGPKTVMEFNKMDSLSEIIVNGDEKYCRIFYSVFIRCAVSGDLWSKDNEHVRKSLEEKYGADKIQFDEKKHLVIIPSVRSMIAISGKNKNDWKYVEYSGTMGSMFIKLIPEEVQKKLGE